MIDELNEIEALVDAFYKKYSSEIEFPEDEIENIKNALSDAKIHYKDFDYQGYFADLAEDYEKNHEH